MYYMTSWSYNADPQARQQRTAGVVQSLFDTVIAPDADAVSWINPWLRTGEMRKVITGIPEKTGVVYTLDRETGEFLWATPTVARTSAATSTASPARSPRTPRGLQCVRAAESSRSNQVNLKAGLESTDGS